MRAQLLALLLAGCGAAFAGSEFDQIVKAVESHYGVKRTHIPFMGVANLVVKMAHPAGTSEFKLAVFEDLDSSPRYGDQADLDEFINHAAASGELHPLIRVRSQRDRESTYIFAGEFGKSTRVLIATFERDEATVIEVKANIEALLRAIQDPEHAGTLLGGDRREGHRDSSNDR